VLPENRYSVICQHESVYLQKINAIAGYKFEVGGKNKGLKQIQDLDKAFIVKDDIELGYLNTIPLWQFGLTY
jgi:hypothetical protein